MWWSLHWLCSLSNGRCVYDGTQTDIFAIGLPPADFAAATRVQTQITLVHRHVDEDQIGDVTERADHFEWLRFRSTWR
jgi:hypothetical protein